jgi:hypothetical protein
MVFLAFLRPLPFIPSPEERGENDSLQMLPLSPWERGPGGEV